MAMKFAVEYYVPVLCWVDVEEGTITGVTEIIESIEPTGRLVTEDGEYFEDPAAVVVATEIADSADWPAWEKGY
jgi:hypothetical protein